MKNEDYLKVSVGGIEVHAFGVRKNPQAPVVFITHGRGGEVGHVFGYARDLVSRGLLVIAVEQRNHGRRLVDGAANGGWSLHHSADMYGIFVGTALDISLLIDALPARLGLTMSRIGMTGVSLGGHATLAAMALDRRIYAGAPLVGAGDYRYLMMTRAATNQCPPRDFAQYFPPALARMVRKFDPVHHPARFANRPLLMLNGGQDTLVPPECNRRLEARLRPHYTNAAELQLRIFEGVGHAVPDAMWAAAADWLCKHCQGDSAAT